MNAYERQQHILAALRAHSRPPPPRVVPRVLWRVFDTGRVSAVRLAAECGVCVRTIYRDVEVLRSSGVPIGALGGRGGGFWIDPEAPPAPVALDSEELARVVLALIAAPGETSESREVLVSKLIAAVPVRTARALRTLADEAAKSVPTVTEAVGPGVLTAVRQGVDERRILSLFHRGERRSRFIEPGGLALRDGCWHLRGRDRETKRECEVPLDQVVNPRLRGARRNPPWARARLEVPPARPG